MSYMIRRMNEDYAVQILSWRYNPPYDFYNNELNLDNVRELLDNAYYTVLDENEWLVGFFCMGNSAKVPIGNQFGAYSEEMVDIGIGMKPALTGQGHGGAFFSFVLGYIQDTYKEIPIRLTVAKFNQRAIHLYEKYGFVKRMEFNQESTVFITMVMGA
ncbi:GNAT family N-acetyltransferase [Pradoshia sp.]